MIKLIIYAVGCLMVQKIGIQRVMKNPALIIEINIDMINLEILPSGSGEIEILRGKNYVTLVKKENNYYKFHIEPVGKIFRNFHGKIHVSTGEKVLMGIPPKSILIIKSDNNEVKISNVNLRKIENKTEGIVKKIELKNVQAEIMHISGFFDIVNIFDFEGNIEITTEKFGGKKVLLENIRGNVEMDYACKDVFLRNIVGEIKGKLTCDTLLIEGGKGEIALSLPFPTFFKVTNHEGKLNIKKE